MVSRASFILLGLAAMVGLLHCDRKVDREGSSASPSAKTPQSVLCLNAASTKDALSEIAKLFEKTSGVVVKFSPEDSSKLANQIVQGAPADVFLSANDKWADFVKDKGLAAETKPLLGNSLVLVVPKGNGAQVKSPADLKTPAVKRIAIAGPTVPAGIYAKAALTSLSLWDELEKGKKFAQGENVRSTLTFVERGEAEAGIVYATDAKVSNKVEVAATFEPSTHPKIVYPLVLLKRGAENESAKKWFDFLQSKEATAVFKKHGFISLVGS